MADSRGHGLCACPGCGAKVEKLEGPGHAYLGTVPGCWALAGQVFAREYSDDTYREVHGLTVDAYAVQHQGEPERRTINSLCFRLIGLHLALDLGLPPEMGNAFFIMSRVPGLVAHAVEEMRRERPMRTVIPGDAEYTGPAPTEG